VLKKLFSAYMAVILLLSGCSSNNQQDLINNEQNPQREQGNEKLEVIAESLNVPWSIESLDNTFYLTERSISQELTTLAGKILRMNLDGTVPNDNPL
jgi:glucose/arabinose dehydrogenase